MKEALISLRDYRPRPKVGVCSNLEQLLPNFAEAHRLVTYLATLDPEWAINKMYPVELSDAQYIQVVCAGTAWYPQVSARRYEFLEYCIEQTRLLDYSRNRGFTPSCFHDL